MLNTLFWTILRSVAIPIIAVYLLRETFLGEEGALIAVGLALTITNIIGVAWNLVKIVGNTFLLKPIQVLRLVLVIGIQVAAPIILWFYYLSEHTDLLSF